MIKRIKWALLLSLLLCSSLAGATCRTESEIPSSTPTSQFTDNGNGTVSDSATGLMWAKCAIGQDVSSCAGSASTLNWQGALQTAGGSTLATHADWRLPNIKELRSIVEQRCYNPSINPDIFPNTPASSFWSASLTDFDSYIAWYVFFYNGVSSYLPRHYNTHVRLVRSGR